MQTHHSTSPLPPPTDFKDTTHEFKESYSYYRHGYSPVTHRCDNKVSNMLNDDNVNACCLMLNLDDASTEQRTYINWGAD